ncbi:MAG: hypothetical protein MZU91_06935 [Desulfosudis oleivorans]|nr:hypothetical protein [Desulfosudis oleivorans]
MEVGIDGETLSPRTRISSVGYALRCQLADTVAAGAVGADQIKDDSEMTTVKLSVTGGLLDQALKIGGSGAAWSADSLELPYAGSVADSGAAFTVENTGTGLAGILQRGGGNRRPPRGARRFDLRPRLDRLRRRHLFRRS